MEALAAFFLESTFLGLWIFGWDRLSPRLHLAIIYVVAFGSTLSAYFILAANSWMQHPVGYVINHASGPAELTSIGKVLTNSTAALRVPAHDRRRVHDRRDDRGRRLRLAHRARLRRADVLARDPARAADRLRRGDPHDARRPRPGAADDQAAADEDGRRRGALHDAAAARRSRSSRSRLRAAADPLDASTSRSRTASRSSRATPGTGRSRASTTSTANTRRSTAPGNYAPIIGVTYWSFRIMTGIGFLRHPAQRPRAAAALAGPARASRRYLRLADLRDRAADPRQRRAAGSSPRWAASRGSCRAS